MGSFEITKKQLDKIYSNGKFHDYNDFFITMLNTNFEDLSCVLISNGPYPRKYGLWTLRYFCKHDGCERFYKVFQISPSYFTVYRNNIEQVNHDVENPISRPMRGLKRLDGQNKLKRMFPDKYLRECENAADKTLLGKGNLQGVVSVSVAKHMRSVALSANDLAKDEIIDLLLMEVSENKNDDSNANEKEQSNDQTPGIYLRRICLDPFVIIMFKDKQFDCLKLLSRDGESITIYFDATGGVVRHGGKVIYYYPAVTRDTSLPLKPHEQRRILPLFESINGAHDAFNIGLVLSEYKHQFHIVKFPTLQWPIKRAVSDISYAILNAICHSWNRTKLIDYINLTYELREYHGIETIIRICCGHISKNYSKDVAQHYPNMLPEHQTLMKEIFAGMFDILDLQKLRTIWNNFSTLLISRNTDENVMSYDERF